MFESGFKRFNNVTILKVFGDSASQDASITYVIVDDKTPRFAIVREPTLESYTTVSEDCTGTILHKPKPEQNYREFTEEILQQFATALKEGIPVNLVIAVIKKGRNVEYVSKAEFL